jgi:hypothetical protein
MGSLASAAFRVALARLLVIRADPVGEPARSLI